jgi:tetratricopeptide (TPR) repeat protein
MHRAKIDARLRYHPRAAMNPDPRSELEGASAPPPPLPVAALARRARNAKSAKDRHDVAETSVEALDALSTLDGEATAPGTLQALVMLGSIVRKDPVRWDAVTARAVEAARALASARGDADLEAKRLLVQALHARGEYVYSKVDIVAARSIFGEAVSLARDVAMATSSTAADVNLRVSVLGWLETVETAAGSPRPEALAEADTVIRARLPSASGPEERSYLIGRLASIHDTMAVRCEVAEPERSRRLREEAMRLRQESLASAKGGDRPTLERGVARIRDGDTLDAALDPAGALVAYESAIAELRRFATESPSNVRAPRLVSVALNRMGEIHERAGRLDAARTCYEEALAMRRAARAARPEDASARRDLSISLRLVARLSLREGRVPTATAHAEELAVLSRERASEEAESAITQEDLIEALEMLAEVRLAQGDRPAAAALLREAVGRVGPLEARMPSLAAPLERMRGRLGSLEDDIRVAQPARPGP